MTAVSQGRAQVLAGIIGTLTFLADGSFGPGVDQMFYAIVAARVYWKLFNSNKNASKSIATVAS